MLRGPVRSFTPAMCIVLISLLGCARQAPHDLAITNVRVYDSRSTTVIDAQTVLVDGDSIAAVVKSSEPFTADSVIQGNGRLLVPGFVDTHVHLRQLLQRGETMPASIDSDSIEPYRDRLARRFLPYGTTNIVDMGQPEAWMDVTLSWQEHPSPDVPTLFNAGGALISDLDWDQNPPAHHAVVSSPEEAAGRVRAYAARGVRHIKLYWKLEVDEMAAAVDAAHELGLSVYAHTDNNMVSIPAALDLGVRDFEHFFTLIPSTLNLREHRDRLNDRYGVGNPRNIDEFAARMVYLFDYVKADPELDGRLRELIDRLAAEGASLSTALNVLGAAAGAENSAFCSFDAWPPREAPELSYDDSQRRELREAFTVMMDYVRLAHEKGVKLRIGTDCELGGRALLAELMLLSEAGIPVADVLRIATLNGAEALRIDDRYGSIEPGMKADFVLFEKDPLDDYHNFMRGRIVIKGGKRFAE